MSLKNACDNLYFGVKVSEDLRNEETTAFYRQRVASISFKKRALKFIHHQMHNVPTITLKTYWYLPEMWHRPSIPFLFLCGCLKGKEFLS